MPRQQTTITIHFQHGQFIYGRSDTRSVNQMIAIRQALQKCFHPQEKYVGCFSWFKPREKQENPLAWLEPKEVSYYQEASDEAIIQKALTLIYMQGLHDRRTIELCLDITKHPFYQQAERDYQQEKNNVEMGLLSNCLNRKNIALCFARVFSQLGYQFKFPHTSSAKKKRSKLRSPLSPVGVYIRGFR